MNSHFFIFVILFFSQCLKESISCKKDIPEWCHRVDLSSEFKPVCGCDGQTYINSRFAICTGGFSSNTEGVCP